MKNKPICMRNIFIRSEILNLRNQQEKLFSISWSQWPACLINLCLYDERLTKSRFYLMFLSSMRKKVYFQLFIF